MKHELSGKTVFVTGATGFVGGRLVEKLILECGAKVRAFVHSPYKAFRIARFDTEMVVGDLTNDEDVLAAVKGCDVVFHCAYGSSGNADMQRAVSVGGTENVMRAAKEAGVDRVVHVGTLAVYDRSRDGILNEKCPRVYSGNVYADTKLDSEKVAERYMQDGLDVTVIQPTSVYGPWAPIWTVCLLNQFRWADLLKVPARGFATRCISTIWWKGCCWLRQRGKRLERGLSSPQKNQFYGRIFTEPIVK